MFEKFHSCEKSILITNLVLPIEKFLCLVLSRNVITLQHLIIQFLLYYLANGDAYERLKTIENLKLLALRVVVVTYKVVAYMYNRFQNNSALTRELLVCLKTGRRGEVAAYKRWLLPEIRLYFDQLFWPCTNLP